jgi:predicted ATPase/class 3 adenylate cyclase/Tfp pilus assembly protein PilF
MFSLPSGVVTLVFTDIEGSSTLWERHGETFAPVLDAHNRLLRAAAVRWHGAEVKNEGDAFFLSFAKASDALRFAVEAQQALSIYDWSTLVSGINTLRVRMGLHSGEPIAGEHPDGTSDYFGPTVNRAARVGAVGHGGQIVISDVTRGLCAAGLPSEITFLDLGKHRLKGIGDEHLWQVLHPALPSDFPPPATLSRVRHNLPLPNTPFIGREDEVETGLRALSGQARLLTLTGFGGLGKTRLALHLAELSADNFSDGVWWVELEEAHTADEMIMRIAQELRVSVQAELSVREQLLHFLRERRILLALDNLEQIPDAPLVVDSLLQASPHLKCLVTTRRALEIQAERLFEIQPLSGNDAQMLFVERAKARNAAFAITPENAADVMELCRRLERMPLAIELAASRIPFFTPREMVQRLNERLRLLQSRTPDLPPRQRALRATIDWSYDLLSDEDKTLFQQLSVFSGGFTLEAAETVCDSYDVLDSMMELRRHSLLRSATNTNQQTRYLMLDSVRDYAQEKLSAGGQSMTVHERHARYFLNFANGHTVQFRTANDASSCAALMPEAENLRAALKWARESSENLLSAEIALALHLLLYRHGFWDEGWEYLQQGISALSTCTADSRRIRAHLFLERACLEYHRGFNETGERDIKDALALFRELNDEASQARALNILGSLSMEMGRFDVARTLFDESLALRAPNDHRARGATLHNMGQLAARCGNETEALQIYEDALMQRRAAGDAEGEARTVGNVGGLLYKKGDLTNARCHYQQSLSIYQQLDVPLGVGLMLRNLSEVSTSEGDYQLAIILLVQAKRIFGELQSKFSNRVEENLQALKEKLGDDEFSTLYKTTESISLHDLLSAMTLSTE